MKRMYGWMLVTMMLLGAGCAVGDDLQSTEEGAYADHDEMSDFEPSPNVPSDGKGDVISATFDQNFVITDEFYTDADALNASQLQALLENTPYGRPSWLASATVGGKPVSRILAETSQRHGINPLMILTRFQVEGGHISKRSHPGNWSANRALGCGCFDGQACSRSYLGLDKQIECAANTLSDRYQDSVNGTGAWRKGRTRSSLDPRRITPATHATAALYAYTPWVLVGRGGNWLVWNVMKKFLSHIRSNGNAGFGETSDVWVGSPCSQDSECEFLDGQNPGFCYDFVDGAGQTRGFCSLVCEGFCPDRAGHATTFCVEGDVAGVGICASRAGAANNECASVDGTRAQDAARFIGTSSASEGVETVCLP